MWRQVLLDQKMVLKCFKIQIFSNAMVYSTEKVVMYQNRPDLCSRSTNEIFKQKRREKCLQLTAYSSGINVLRD